MIIRNKLTGQTFEVLAGTLYPSFFEEVTDDNIKVGEPKVEYTMEETLETIDPEEKPKKKTTSKKGAKKNGKNKRN